MGVGLRQPVECGQTQHGVDGFAALVVRRAALTWVGGAQVLADNVIADYEAIVVQQVR
ncbi:hypothetical protein D3C78_1708960 [compost metagenome]